MTLSIKVALQIRQLVYMTMFLHDVNTVTIHRQFTNQTTVPPVIVTSIDLDDIASMSARQKHLPKIH